jgi:hypothetical protein
MAMRCGFQNKMRKNVLFFLTLLVLNTTIYAGEYQAQIKRADLASRNNQVFFSADLDFHLSPQANEALQNGVPLFWNIKMKVQRERNFWFDKTLLKRELHYGLQYHALLKMYQVKNENTGSVKSFSTLTAALNEMGTVRDFDLNTFEQFLLDENYWLEVKVIFDEEKLPLPLQTKAFANLQWQLSSDWTKFELFKTNAQN